MSVYQWLCLLAVPNLFFLFWSTIINRRQKKKDEAIVARRAEIEQQQELIKQQNEQLEAQNKATMLGVQALLRDRLISGYKQFEAQGWADIDERSNLENVYVQYHNLGQNGVMDDLRNKFLQLPTHPTNP